MGRQKTFRQRARQEAASIQAKTLFCSLKSLVKKKRVVSDEEALLIASDSMEFLNQYLGKRQIGQIEFPVIINEEQAHFRRSRAGQEEKLVNLTIIDDEDAQVYEEFGFYHMVIGRMARLIEEAYYQGGLLDYTRLLTLFPTTVKAIRKRLDQLIEQGATLPLAGMTKKKREKFKALRGVLAVERYLQGEALGSIRKDLHISSLRWQEWWNAFRMAARMKETNAEELSRKLGQPQKLVEGWLELWNTLEDKNNGRLKEELNWTGPLGEAFSSYRGFMDLLCERHGFSPAAAENMGMELIELGKTFSGKERAAGQIIYIGVSSAEGAGRSLEEVQMEPVVLDYLTEKDWGLADRENPGELRWERVKRFATQAYSQGVALNLPDLAYLVSISVEAIRSLKEKHPDIILPTRGQVADIGTTLSHMEKIIDLYMYGYTETEITRRTGHSYESVERYLIDFGKFVVLTEYNIPLPSIRQVTGFSRRMVEKHQKLYEKYNHPDFMFTMAKIRRIGLANNPKKEKKEGDRKDDDG